MRTYTIGSPAISTRLILKHNSKNKFSLFFWDDVNSTIPTVMTGVTITLEIEEVLGGTVTTWTATNTLNEAVFDQSPASSQFTWDTRPFQVIFTKTAIREVVMTGEVQVQR